MASSKKSLKDEIIATEQNIENNGNNRNNILKGLHGHLYQIKLLMLYLVNGVSKKYESFRLSTELQNVTKFDDLIFELKENTENETKQYWLLQAKHKENQLKKLDLKDDLLQPQGDYSLMKYFASYHECEETEMFKEHDIKDLILFTNLDFDLEKRVKVNDSEDLAIKNFVIELEEENDILNFKNENLERKPARYRFNEKIIPHLKTLIQHQKLAEKLTDCLLKNSPIEFKKPNIYYFNHDFLTKEVIDVKSKKFQVKFLNNKGKAIDFMKIFKNEIQKRLKKVDLKKLNSYIEKGEIENQKIGLNIAKDFQFDEVKGLNEKYDIDLDTSIKRFLNHLVFAVNQPNIDDLDRIIKNHIKKSFGILQHNEYDVILVKMANWAKGDGKEFISYKDANKWFSTIKLEHLTMEFTSKIEKEKIFFKSDCVKNLTLNKFLCSEHTELQIFNFITNVCQLTSIKLYQVLKNNDFEDKYYFLSLKSVLENKDEVISCLKDGIFLLIIQFNTEENISDIVLLAIDMLNIIQQNAKNKIILITKPGNIFVNIFKEKMKDSYQELEDIYNNFIDLDNESQTKLLHKSVVVFQGKEENLSIFIETVDSRNFLDIYTLPKLIDGEKIEIGKPLMDLSTVKNFFIERTFNRKVEFKKDIEENEDFVLVDCYDDIQKYRNNLKNQDIILISNEKTQFEKLCENFKEKNIHWIIKESNEYIWQQTHNSLFNLRKFCSHSESNSKMKIEDLKNNEIVIITGEPGIGKTTILTEIGKELKRMDQNNWIARINLLDCSSQFLKWNENGITITAKQALQFIFKNILLQKFNENIMEFIHIEEENNNKIIFRDTEKISIKGANMLELRLLIQFYNERKLTILCDGFDEIAPNYAENVIEILKILKKSKLSFWISSRNYNIVDDLENALGTFSYKLEKFSTKDQKDFLHKFLKYKLNLDELDSNRFDSFINEFFEEISKSFSDLEFLAIPLHCLMIAEYFEDDFKSYYNSDWEKLSEEQKIKLNKKINLGILYESFIRKKFYDILYGEKGKMNMAIPSVKSLVDTEYKKRFDDYIKLAFYSMFEKENLKQMFGDKYLEIDIQKLLVKIQEGGENLGIVIKIVNGKPYFVHLTFAEYFIAKYIWEKFKSIPQTDITHFIYYVLVENIIRKQKNQIADFLQSIATEELNNHIPFKDKNDKIKVLLFSIIKSLHFENDEKSRFGAAEVLLKIIESALATCKINDSEFLEHVRNLKIDIRINFLNISAKYGFKNIIAYSSNLIETKEIENNIMNGLWKNCPLYHAISNYHFDIAQMLVEKFNIKSTWLDNSKSDLQAIFNSTIYCYNEVILKRCFELEIFDYNIFYGDIFNRNIAYGYSVLFSCIEQNCSKDLIKFLIIKADINIINSAALENKNFLFAILYKYDKEIIHLLLERGFNFNRIFEDSRYDMSWSISNVLKSDFINFCHENLEILLKNGVTIPLQFLKFLRKLYFLFICLFELFKSSDKNDDNYTHEDKLLKLIIECMDEYSEFGFEYYSENEEFLCYKKEKSHPSDDFHRCSEYDIKLYSQRIINERYKKIFNKRGGYKITTEDILYVLNLQNLYLNSFFNSSEFRNMEKDIYDGDLISVLIYMKNYCNKNIHDTINKFKDIFFVKNDINFFNIWLKNYSDLIQIIGNKNNIELENMLKNIKDKIYLKSIINSDDEIFGSPLHLAVSTSNSQAVNILLSYGANRSNQLAEYNPRLFNHISEKTVDLKIYFKGYLPLHIAATTGNKKIFNVLFENGEIDIKDGLGKTPLHYAAIAGNIEMLKYIIKEKFVDPSIQDKDGKICQDYVKLRYQSKMMPRFLKRKFSEISKKGRRGE